MIAKFYKKKDANTIKCILCPHNCLIKADRYGICKTRKNVKGVLISETYRKCSALSFDPVEKKPLYHFFPGKSILSIGSVGCNMHCKWCQNCDISQVGVRDTNRLTEFTPQELLRVAQSRNDNIGIAFTYNEPLINIESNLEVAELFSKSGFKNIAVSNGFIAPDALKEYLKFIDAFNIDVKGFNEKNYKHFTGGSLKNVLENLLLINNADKHLEITYLVVPEVNDSEIEFKKFVLWVQSNLGPKTILHLSRYFPRYKFKTPETPVEKLLNMAKIASEELTFTYVGNLYIREYQNTVCPDCGHKIINRMGYMINVDPDSVHGECPVCKSKIYISE